MRFHPADPDLPANSIMNRWLELALVMLVVSLSAGSKIQAAIINGYDASRHNRFLPGDVPNPTFLIDESQLSGVAMSRAVLITPQHYVTAAHVNTATVTFRGTDGVMRTYNSSGAVTLQTFIQGEGDVSSDIRVHSLAAPVDPSIVPVPIAIGDSSSFLGQEIYIVDQNRRVGRNIVEDVVTVEFGNGNGDSTTVRYSFDTQTNGGSGTLGIDEAGLLGGDSGNSALISINGQISLIGTHMGIAVPMGNNQNSGDLYDSYTTLLSPYVDQLNTIVGSDGYSVSTLSVSAVPEPGSFAIVAIIGCCLTFRRRSRRD